MLGFAHLKFLVIIVTAILLYLLADRYHVPIDGVLLFTGIGAILACAWDKLTSMAT